MRIYLAYASVIVCCLKVCVVISEEIPGDSRAKKINFLQNLGDEADKYSASFENSLFFIAHEDKDKEKTKVMRKQRGDRANSQKGAGPHGSYPRSSGRQISWSKKI